MAAYLVGQMSVKNEALWQKYVAGVAESLKSFDAQVLFRGQLTEVLAGTQGRGLCVVIRFTDQAALMTWFKSDAYQALIPLRDRAADVVISSYEE